MSDRLSFSNTLLGIISLLIGVLIGSSQIVKGVYSHFFKEKNEIQQMITEDYIFIENRSYLEEYILEDTLKEFLNSSSVYNTSVEETLARRYLERINALQSNWITIHNDVLESYFNPATHHDIAKSFCSNLDESEPGLEAKCLNKYNYFNDENKYLQTIKSLNDMAFYTLTNNSGKPFKNIDIEYAVVSTKTPLWTLDPFIKGLSVNNGCLQRDKPYEDGFKECLVPIDEFKTIRINNLQPGKRLLFPIYFHTGYAISGKSELYYDGFVNAQPIHFPTKITIDGKVIIEEVREMSITPTIMFGDIEARG